MQHILSRLPAVLRHTRQRASPAQRSDVRISVGVWRCASRVGRFHGSPGISRAITQVIHLHVSQLWQPVPLQTQKASYAAHLTQAGTRQERVPVGVPPRPSLPPTTRAQVLMVHSSLPSTKPKVARPVSESENTLATFVKCRPPPLPLRETCHREPRLTSTAGPLPNPRIDEQMPQPDARRCHRREVTRPRDVALHVKTMKHALVGSACRVRGASPPARLISRVTS